MYHYVSNIIKIYQIYSTTSIYRLFVSCVRGLDTAAKTSTVRIGTRASNVGEPWLHGTVMHAFAPELHDARWYLGEGYPGIGAILTKRTLPQRLGSQTYHQSQGALGRG